MTVSGEKPASRRGRFAHSKFALPAGKTLQDGSFGGERRKMLTKWGEADIVVICGCGGVGVSAESAAFSGTERRPWTISPDGLPN